MQLNELKKKYKITDEILVIFIIIFALLALRLIIQNYPELEFYHKISDIYSDFLIFNTRLLLSFVENDFIFNFTNNSISSSGIDIKIDRFFYSLNQVALLFIIILITKSPYKNKIIFFLFGFLIFSLYNILRISVHVNYPNTISTKNWLFNILLIPRWIILVILVWYYWNKFSTIKGFILKKVKLTEKFYTDFLIKLIAVIIFYHITIIIIFNNSFFINGDLLVNAILSTSNYFINQLGYESWLAGKTIWGYKAALYMDDACIGINLMFLFAAFIAMLPGSFWHKLWFIPAGLFIIVLFNITRIVFIFISLTNNNGEYKLFMEIHDIFTYPVLIFTFYLWVVWINNFALKSNRINKI